MGQQFVMPLPRGYVQGQLCSYLLVDSVVRDEVNVIIY
jgi:hypothetical protein